MLTCRHCRRGNPDSASYCWYDGVHLGSPHQPVASADDEPVKRFNPPLLLRSGVSIASFPDLGRLATAHWEDLLVALRDGSLEKMFRRIQRDDLAQRAAWAAKHVDPEQALDELLERLPGVRREGARLVVEPVTVDLGSISRTTPRSITLKLTNRGQALLQGTVRVEGAAWLSVGDAAGVQQKIFRCPRELSLTVRVVGKALRASTRPLEAKLIVETNGGSREIPVRASVPVIPFGEGVLMGATSPKALAEKARQSPKEAVPLFERGLVVAWYEANGWSYPVRGLIAEGLGALQQFFEALGQPAPVVTLSEPRIELRGAVGESARGKIVLTTTEQKVVYGHGVAHADWLEVGRPALEGQRATLPITVRRIPDRPNERLRTTVEIETNGLKKFQVEVVLHVLPGPARKTAPDTHEAPDWLFANVPATPTASPQPVKQSLPRKPAPAVPIVVESAPVMPVRQPQSLPVAIPMPTPAPDTLPVVTPTAARTAPVFTPNPAPRPVPTPAANEEDESSASPWLFLLLPLLLLGVGLGGLVLHDLLLPNLTDPKPDIVFDEGPLDPVEYVRIEFNERKRDDNIGKIVPVNMTFGLTARPLPGQNSKQLTYDSLGRSNNTCVQVDGRDSLFGGTIGGTWVKLSEPLPPPKPGEASPGQRSIWRTPGDPIEVTQEVELIRSDTSRKLDTCLVRYTLTNKDARPHQVGLRFLLDTYIGGNDGTPFTIPGEPGLCDTLRDFRTAAEVPDYLTALEKESLADPGMVAHLRLKLGSKIEAPSRVLLGAWPDENFRRLRIAPVAAGPETLWEVPALSMRDLYNRFPAVHRDSKPIDRDSAVTLYWQPQPLAPNSSRVVGFAYGLGQVASTNTSQGKLALTVGGRLVRNGEFTLTAMVAQPAPGEVLTLELPPGLEPVGGALQQPVPQPPAGSARPISTLTWKLKANQAGSFKVTVRSSRNLTESTTIAVRSQGVFD